MKLILLLSLTACSPGLRFPGPLDSLGAPTPERTTRRSAPSEGLDVALAAEYYIGKKRLSYGGTVYRYDCSGLIEAVYARAALPLRGNSVSLFDLARDLDVLHHEDTPDLGDVAFFENTYDRDGDGKIDDGITHVAVVSAVDGDGTITLVHKGSHGVMPLYMNLRHPDTYQDKSGKVLNSVLRVKRSDDPRNTHYLTGELWEGFASFWRAHTQS